MAGCRWNIRWMKYDSFRHPFGMPTFGVLHRLNPPQAATMQERPSKREAREGLKLHFRLNLPLAAVENTFLRGEKAENEENGRFFD